ncbi:MAG: hypothetical protein AAGC58_12965 [Asticcacaulis sp.]
MKKPLVAALFATLGLGLSGNALAQKTHTVAEGSDLSQFRSLRAEGMAALEKNDRQNALRLFTEAGNILPDSPSILLLKAQAELELKRRPNAKALLSEYIRRGLTLDLGRHSEFIPIWDETLEAKLAENRSAKGAVTVLHTLPDLNLIEALTVTDEGVIIVSAIHTGTISRVTDAGLEKIVAFRPGVAAQGVTWRNGQLWATTAATRQTKGFDGPGKITSKIIRIDPANGTIAETFNTDIKRRLSDIHAGDEDLYVADFDTGEVLRLNGYKGTPEVLIPEGYLEAPQGLVESADGRYLMVADHSSGLYRVDLHEGSLIRLMAPDNGVLMGMDSLLLYGNDIIAVQNGLKPERILRLRMQPDWGGIDSAEVILRGGPDVQEPSGAQIVGNRLIFVARSQWSEFNAQGLSDNDTPKPALIGEITLTP